MCYDHRERIGNEGDVVKHAVLCRFVKKVTEIIKPNSEQPAIYAESHSGRALYMGLPADGRWRFGIGALSAEIVKLDPTKEAASESKPDSNLRPYLEACFKSKIQAGSDYHGSSGIVFNMLRKSGTPFRFHLWDNNITVCHSLMGFCEGWSQVSICWGNGYEGVCMVEKPSLVLVDPVSIKEPEERDRIISTLQHLANSNTPFICWTALVKGEEPESGDFKARTESDFSVHWVTWKPKKGTTIGCQITVPKGIWEPLAADTLAELRESMKKERET